MSDTGTMTSSALAGIYRDHAEYTQVYLDMSVDTADPPGVQDERRTSVLDRLALAGSPQRDLDCVADVLATATTGPSPFCLFVLVRDGVVVVEEVLPGLAVEPEITSYGPLPDLVPLLKAQPLEFTYLTVETARDGGEVQLFRAGSRVAESEDHVQGRTDTLHKIKGGGWRHDHMQNHAEEIWRQTQSELASTVDDIVRIHRPRLLVVAGDIRARQLLEQELSEASRAILSIEPTNTRADGSTDSALPDRVDEEIERILNLVELNFGGVVLALAAGQVDTLIVDSDRLRERQALALDAEPWVASAPEDALGARLLGPVPAQLALCRAALLTDARVLFTDSFRVPDGQDAVALPNEASAAAILRWRTGPPVPGT